MKQVFQPDGIVKIYVRMGPDEWLWLSTWHTGLEWSRNGAMHSLAEYYARVRQAQLSELWREFAADLRKGFRS